MAHKRTKFEHSINGLLSNTINSENGCMIWQGAINSNGYGIINQDGKTTTVSRAMLEYVYGKQPSEIYACHTCDNPPCINPNHLFPATNSDNLQDAQNKGRMRKAQHGTRSKYVYGCKCQLCLDAEAKYARDRRNSG